MAAEQPTQSADFALHEAQIRDFLERDPDFFQRNPDLLRTLHIPHASGDAVSLVERQVSVLRERNVDLRRRLRDLTDAAHHNEQLYTSTRRLVLELLEVQTLQSLFDTFANSMQRDFSTDQAAIIVFDDAAGDNADESCRRAARAGVTARLGALMKGDKPTCGALRTEEFNYLFPSARGSGSAALVPMRHHDTDLGLIAVGSADARRYHPAMGTVFLEHIAAVIARLLARINSGS